MWTRNGVWTKIGLQKTKNKTERYECLNVSQLGKILLMDMEERGKRKEEREKEKGDTIEKIGSTQSEEEEGRNLQNSGISRQIAGHYQRKEMR